MIYGCRAYDFIVLGAVINKKGCGKMNVIINGKELKASDCKEVFDYGSHVLVIMLKKDEEIDSNSLEKLVFANEDSIILDNDGEIKTFTGFTGDACISIKPDSYEIKLYKTASNDEKIAELEKELAKKDDEISEHEKFVETEIYNAISEGVNEV